MDVFEAKAKGAVWTPAQVRKQYHDALATIRPITDAMRDRGASPEQRARTACLIRKAARLNARVMMSNPEDVRALEARDQRIYGQPDGPTFDQCLEKALEQGYAGADAFEEVIQGATRTSKEYDERSQTNR